jgi:hypothetical protein
MAEIRGGEKFEAALAEIARMLGPSRQLKVGFLSTATYPDGKPVAMIAAIQNFGAPRAGIPPRPFFSDMVRKKSPEWPAAIGALLVRHKYDAARVMQITGEAIAGQLRQSIIETNEPPLAESTVKRKGFSKPLVHTGFMLNSVDYEIKT